MTINFSMLGPIASTFSPSFKSWDSVRQELILEMLVNGSQCNGSGYVQGGSICSILDIASTCAALYASDFKLMMPTLELKASFFASLSPGSVIAYGRVIRGGSRVSSGGEGTGRQ